MAKNKKIVKYRKSQTANMGVIIFFVIFLYMCYNVFQYFTQEHVSVYEVQAGEISKNTTYTGLVIRDEAVYTTDASGYINYYRKDSSKVSTSSVVYTIDTNGDVAEKITRADSDGSLLKSETLKNVENSVNTYISDYDDMSFFSIYNFKTGINAKVKENVSLAALDSLSDAIAYAQNSNTFFTHYPDQPGIITYYTDGYESVKLDNFTKDQFQESTYSKKDLRKRDKVKAGDAVYKLLINEDWSVVIPIDHSMAKQLKDTTVIQTKFLKDDSMLWANSEIIEREGRQYLVLNYKSGMVRFANDRFLRIELQLEQTKGLKIPNSSITKKTFYKVPEHYFYRDEESGSLGVLLKSSSSTTPEFLSATKYKIGEKCYIEEPEIHAGDTLIDPENENKQYVLSDSKNLKGVYNINKGYAIFRLIDILYQNEEYSIVQTGTANGIAVYDHIALDGKSIHEGELIH